MQPVYSRIHRLSIYDPATIHDFPFEVLENCLKYLKPLDLVAPSLACRAWYPAAAGLMYFFINLFDKPRKRAGRFVCGLHLRDIVFGTGSCKIERLDLDISKIKRVYIPLITRQVGPTLSSLFINFRGSLNHYGTLDIFLNQCSRIRNLRLEYFKFGDDPAAITPVIKDGFARLYQLNLFGCLGDVSMFVNHTPIHQLESLQYYSNREPIVEDRAISSLAMKCRSLSRVVLHAKFESSTSY
jgi:hypothetical protein